MSVYKKIQMVMAKVSYLQKDTKSQGYTAITHNKVTDSVREHCANVGLIILPHLKSEEVVNIEREGKSPGVRYRCTYDFKFIDPDASPTETAVTSVRVSAHADDFGDKAPGKALSYAMKSAMLKVFLIPSGDDDEERVEFDKAKKRLAEEKISDDQHKALRAAMDEVGINDAQFCAKGNCLTVGSLPAARYDGAMKWLKQLKDKTQ